MNNFRRNVLNTARGVTQRTSERRNHVRGKAVCLKTGAKPFKIDSNFGFGTRVCYVSHASQVSCSVAHKWLSFSALLCEALTDLDQKGHLFQINIAKKNAKTL